MDQIVYCDRLPHKGETIKGHSYTTGFGGKGANQAVQAAMLGSSVAMVGCVGQDDAGYNYLAQLKSLGINTEHVAQDIRPTGVAAVTCDDAGHNTIVIAPGANDAVSPASVKASSETVASARVMLTQLEVPNEATLAALEMAQKRGVFSIFNPAPAQSGLPSAFLKIPDIVCLNETETHIVAGIPVETLADAKAAARSLVEQHGVRMAMLTLGERGTVYYSATMADVQHIPAQKVQAVDSVGAGDSFLGALAHYLATKDTMDDAVRKATSVAGASVLKRGTQASYIGHKEAPQ